MCGQLNTSSCNLGRGGIEPNYKPYTIRVRFRSEQNKAEQNLFHKLVQSGSFENKTCTHITSHVIQERSTEHSLETRIDTRCFLLKKHFEDT